MSIPYKLVIDSILMCRPRILPHRHQKTQPNKLCNKVGSTIAHKRHRNSSYRHKTNVHSDINYKVRHKKYSETYPKEYFKVCLSF